MSYPKRLLLATLAIFGSLLQAQPQDIIPQQILDDITIVGQSSPSDIHQLPQIVGTNIYAAKKSALIVLDNVHGNVVTNTMRQVMAKVPGIFTWESEGSGIQIGIAARGLSPNRSWEFNVRQNGYDIAADPYGYPEAYYNPQLQSVQRIEFVRGHGALQYGPQLGGMVNYILKNGSEFSKPFQVETFQTIGSNKLFNTYNAVGGKTSKVNYYVFYDRRQGDGWRENNEYNTNTLSGTVTYKPIEKLSLTAEFVRWDMLSQQPGGLTDDQFKQDSKQSLRSRNWFNLIWHTAALTSDLKINNNQRLNVKLFGIMGDRSSVGFMPSGGIVVEDAINPNTGEYNPRAVNIDYYRNFGMEARYVNHYTIGRQESSLSTGIRLYTGSTDRLRSNNGTTGTGFTTVIAPGSIWEADIDYNSANAAVFIENLFRISDRLVLIPGIRYEYVKASAAGYASLSGGTPAYLQKQERGRDFVLAGFGAEFNASKTTQFYANITQSYRPVQFADLTTPPTTDVIDPDLKDASGYNFDVGYRGQVKNFVKFDVSAYHLQYNNRIGTIKQLRDDLSSYNLRTNVGGSSANGVEAFAEYDLSKSISADQRYGEISIFSSYSYNLAQYNSFKVITLSGNTLQETNYKNNKVEYAPENIVRTGLTYSIKNLFTTVQYSYTDKVYTDANNTEAPTANGQNGAIPSYEVIDLTFGWKHKTGILLKTGVNNLTDVMYFTRRAGGYPGPGVLPADGRTFFLTLGYQMK
jgi:Fe(3+) dicitrate transport protein